jgi:hypothetical protein
MIRAERFLRIFCATCWYKECKLKIYGGWSVYTKDRFFTLIISLNFNTFIVTYSPIKIFRTEVFEAREAVTLYAFIIFIIIIIKAAAFKNLWTQLFGPLPNV